MRFRAGPDPDSATASATAAATSSFLGSVTAGGAGISFGGGQKLGEKKGILGQEGLGVVPWCPFLSPSPYLVHAVAADEAPGVEEEGGESVVGSLSLIHI